MTQKTSNGLIRAGPLFLIGGIVFSTPGCATAPKKKARPAFIADARAATGWFEENVSGLREQIDDSAGYMIFPGVGQWGFGFGGGKFGRAMVNKPSGSQIGWASISTPSLGLQAGVQGFKMLIVVEDAATLEKFKNGSLSGSVSGVVVAGEAGGSGQAPFKKGVAVYQGANTGLMAGVNVGLDVLRYEPLGN